MPYLQLDMPGPVDAATKRRIAADLSQAYATVMETQRRIPAVVVRDSVDGGPLRFEDGALRDVAVVMCDIRRGRDSTRRELLARRCIEIITAETQLDELHVVVEFTQHEPTEMFRYGAFAPEWSAAEAGA